MTDPLLIGVLSTDFTHDKQFNDNIVGGVPLFPNGFHLPECSNCQEQMAFLLRIDAPVGADVTHRLLYMFICCRPQCLESSPGKCFRLFRFQIMAENRPDADGRIDLDEWHFEGADDWGEDIDGWADTDELADESPPPAVPAAVSFTPLECGVRFDAAYMEVFEDAPPVRQEEKRRMTDHERRLLSEYYGNEEVDARVKELYKEAASTQSQSGDEEEEEEEEEEANSKLLTKFVRRLSPFPHQIVRYQWAGKPLIAEVLPATGDHLRCRQCGGEAAFELQLTPGLFARLRCPDASVTEAVRRVSVATVLVFSCVSTCWNDGQWREESCLVQLETNSNVVPDG